LVPLDQGAPLAGTVVVSGNTKIIQHPYGGVVERIHVQEGSEVKEGDVLITFNDVRSDSALEVARTQWISAMANQNRLSAELAEMNQIVFAPWLQENLQDPRVTAAIALQRDLFNSRKATL
ncbi:biotin/lipoyl-binding protein, partial [Cutibacterium acnes]